MITVVTTAFLRYTKLGTAMRAMANDREITATLGVPVRRVEAAAWFGCGVLPGIAGILLADLVALDATTLTFLVISSLAAALIARLSSIWITFVAAIVIGVVDAADHPDHVADQLSRHDAVRAGGGRAAVPQPPAYAVAGTTGVLIVSTAELTGEAKPTAPPSAPPRLERGFWVRAAVIAVAVLLVIILLPQILSLYYVDAMTQVAIYSVVALGLGVLVGRVGLISLGQAAVLAIGALGRRAAAVRDLAALRGRAAGLGRDHDAAGHAGRAARRCGCAACTWR